NYLQGLSANCGLKARSTCATDPDAEPILAQNVIKNAPSMPRRLTNPDELEDRGAPTPDRVLAPKDLEEQLGRLPPRIQSVVRLYQLGQSVPEIARALAISKAEVAMRLKAGVALLAEAFGTFDE